MHAVSGKTLQSKVLGTTPRLDCNTSDTGEISNHIRVNAIILSNVIKGLFIVPLVFYTPMFLPSFFSIVFLKKSKGITVSAKSMVRLSSINDKPVVLNILPPK